MAGAPLECGTPGWALIAAVVAHSAARAAERHLVRVGAPVGV